MLKVLVDRQKWGRGKLTDSALLNTHTRKMCCIGFVCIAAGLTEDQIADVLAVSTLHREMGEDLPGALKQLLSTNNDNYYDSELHDSAIGSDLMSANDAQLGHGRFAIETEEDREKFIADNGRLAGIEFEFIN